MSYILHVPTPWGLFAAEATDAGICRFWLSNAAPPAATEAFPLPLAEELTQYFAGTRQDFGLPITMEGTAFQLAVWFACRDIPYGETRTYGELAAMAGYPGAARAVGTAMAENPLPILVPCHRVIPSRGGIGRYSGGEALKKALLDLECRSLHE